MTFNYFHQLMSSKERDVIHFLSGNCFHLGKSHFRAIHEAVVGRGGREPFFWQNLAKPQPVLGWGWVQRPLPGLTPGLIRCAGGSVH